ncbi:MAG: sugar phosphate isomerase/epimerase family protein [Chloroflexota bacterium]
MQLALNGATTMSSGLPKDIAAARSAGFSGLEIWAAKMDAFLETHSLQELKTLFRDADLHPVSINSIEFITFRPPNEYEQIRARCRQLCELGQSLGCARIVVVPSPTPEGATWDGIRAESVRVLNDLADIASAYNASLAFEFLGFSWCSVQTLSQCWEIVREVGRNNVGLVIDTCHFFAGGSEMASIRQVEPQKVFILHINDVEDRPRETIEDAHRLLPGEGVIPLDDILIRLKHIGFDGLCSVELFRPAYWKRDPMELAAAARAAALDVLQTYFSVV